jgi:DNA-binding NarL/FixJ family response regulator
MRILMIDDHPLQIDGYKSILAFNNPGYELETVVAYNSVSAYKIITEDSQSTHFEFVFLDYSLPPYLEKKIQSGEDLAYLIKRHMPTTRLVIITSHCEKFLLYNIVKKVNPHGLLIKSDITGPDLLAAFDTLLEYETYYSDTVKKVLKEKLLIEGSFDKVDRELITLLARGHKTETISESLMISRSAIDKRKVKIKELLGIDKGNDEAIIEMSRKMGFIN